jgi:hypothetical protein
MHLSKSDHATVRMAQRSVTNQQVNYIMTHGSNIDDNIVMITNKDFVRHEAALKAELKVLQKLKNKKLVVAGDVIITTYHSSKSDQKKAMKRRRDSF